MDNREIENSIIINRRPTKDNEFVFEYNTPIQNVERLFKYIELISDLKIEKIPREELPYQAGSFGYRIHKRDLI